MPKRWGKSGTTPPWWCDVDEPQSQRCTNPFVQVVAGKRDAQVIEVEFDLTEGVLDWLDKTLELIRAGYRSLPFERHEHLFSIQLPESSCHS